jgi:hypothetical protein
MKFFEWWHGDCLFLVRNESGLFKRMVLRYEVAAAAGMERRNSTLTALWAPGGNNVRALYGRLRIPATESQLSVALALSVLVMSGLLWGILWQANIIAEQREAIRWLWSLHGGHVG